MPQISKVRIVNFNFNDGNRLIPDEIFKFENDNNKTMNTLLNLSNGGGKTVLAQLMVQPVIPNAVISGRSMGSFLNKATDHCYVLLEWKLDNSTDMLVTGISLAAGENNVSDSDSDSDDYKRGIKPKYYTFITTYNKNFEHPNSIINLPLSKKEGNKFIPESYDFIKKFANMNKDRIKIYGDNSDDKKEYSDILNQYGIIQTEWKNIICKVNQEEGGTQKYFADIKTSDQLINKLFINAIEGKINSSNISGEDSSLKQMFFSYARQCNNKSKEIAEQKAIKEFQKYLDTEIEPAVDELGNLNYSCIDASAKMVGFYQALKNEEKNYNDKLADLADKDKLYKDNITTIEHEKISYEYYENENNLSLVLEELKKTDIKLKETVEAVKGTQREIDIFNAAKIHTEICNLQDKLFANNKILEEKQNDKNLLKKIGQLKYSMFVLLEDLIPNLKNEIAALYEKQKLFTDNNIKLNKQYEIDSDNAKKTKSNHDELLGIIKEKKHNYVKKFASFGFDILISLDERFDEKELNLNKKNLEDNKTIIENNIKENLRIKYELDSEMDNINSELEDLYKNKFSNNNELKNIDAKIKEYEEKEEKLLPLLNLYNISEEQKFNGILNNIINQEKDKVLSKIKSLDIEIQSKQRQLELANKGALHIDYLILKYLDNIGLKYKTGENFLLGLDEQNRNDVLEKYPIFAYGIILDSENMKLLGDSPAEWLSSVLPVYTNEDIDNILNNNFPMFKAAAYYSKAYFTDNNQYITNLSNNIKISEGYIDNLNNKNNKLNGELKIAEAFVYDDQYYKNLNENADMLKNNIFKIENSEKDLNKKKETAKANLKINQDNYNKLNEDLIGAKKSLTEFISIVNELPDYYKLIMNKENLYKNYIEFVDNIEFLQKQISENNKLLDETKNDIKTKNSNLSLYETDYDSFKNSDKCEIVEGNFINLKNKFETLNKNIGADLDNIRNFISDLVDRLKDKKSELSEFYLQESDYQNIVFDKNKLDEKILYLKKLNEENEKITVLSNGLKIKEAVILQKKEEINKKLKVYDGVPLTKSKILCKFDERIKEIREQLSNLNKEHKELNDKLAEIKIRIGISAEQIKEYDGIQPRKVELQDNLLGQYEKIYLELKECKKTFELKEKLFRKIVDSAIKKYADTNSNFGATFDAITNFLDNTGLKGDKYYSIKEILPIHKNLYAKKFAQYDADLKDLENSKNDLIRHTLKQGKDIYDELDKISKGSKVKFKLFATKQMMIKIELPENIDILAAKSRFEDEIERNVEDFIKALAINSPNNVLEKIAENSTNSRKLLNIYISQENIPVKVFKIDFNAEHSSYRSWESAIINNSGAEKFIVYFTVMLSLINYSRNNYLKSELFNDNQYLSSCLILDNPFGVITSAHLLDPMFEIAKHFGVQLICMTDITKTDLTKRFDVVTKIAVVPLSFSKKEILQIENTERIEHAWYNTTQMSLF